MRCAKNPINCFYGDKFAPGNARFSLSFVLKKINKKNEMLCIGEKGTEKKNKKGWLVNLLFLVLLIFLAMLILTFNKAHKPGSINTVALLASAR